METIGNKKSNLFEENKTYRTEHFPKLDVVVNLDYFKQKDCNDILKIVNDNLDIDFNIDHILYEISNCEDDKKDQRFFIKIKPEVVDTKTKKIIDLIKNPRPEEVIGDFKNKKARYNFVGVLNEIILSKKIRELVASDMFQRLAKKYGFAGMKFAEPISALIDKEQHKKYLIYKNLELIDGMFPNDDSYIFIDDLRRIFLQNNIFPNDLNIRQFIVTQENGKYYIVLIDIEAYTNIKK